MSRIRFAFIRICVIGLGLLAAPMAWAGEIPVGMVNVPLDPAIVSEIGRLFPARGRVDRAFIDRAVDPNLHLSVDSIVSVTFISESSRRLNTLGWFTYDTSGSILSRGEIFPNFSAVGSGGLLTVGDTVNLGPMAAGTDLGFTLIRDGFNDPGGRTYYSLDSLNANSERRLAMTSTFAGDLTLFGFEDRRRLRGRLDYNDAVFGVTAVTVTNPEPSSSLLLVVGALLLGATRVLRPPRRL